jgi:glutamate synthase (NADPH/NADH) small chain
LDPDRLDWPAPASLIRRPQGHRFERAIERRIVDVRIPNHEAGKGSSSKALNMMSPRESGFVNGIDVGADYGSDQLIEEFDATVLCCGATKPRDLAIEGRALGGIYFAMAFLRANTRSLLDSGHQDKRFISAKDKDVIVIGGGDTGTDCVATALSTAAGV